MELASYISFDGSELKYRYWRRQAPAPVVIILHGIQSHSGWYEALARFLFENGLEVAALDRRGSGMNAARRGDTRNYKALAEDIKTFIEQLKGSRGMDRFHLVGISWGGKLAAVFALLFPELVRSQILMSPGIYSRVDFSTLDRVSILLHYLFSPGKLFPIPIDRPEMFTANPEKIEYIRSDRLSLHHCTARFFFASFRMEKLLAKRVKDLATPTLVMLSENDAIVDNERLEDFFGRMGSSRKRLKVYEGAHHTLEFEKDPIPIFADVLEWIKSSG